MYGTTTTKNNKIEHSFEAMSSILPSHGNMIGWKKAWKVDNAKRMYTVIVKLLIPETAQRSNATGRKCRCSEAKVLGIFDISKDKTLGKEINCTAFSDWDVNFTYRKGKTVRPSSPFCPFRTLECESGIHFFLTLQEALDYKL